MRLTRQTFQRWDLDQGSEEDLTSIRLSHWQCPCSVSVERKGGICWRNMHIVSIFLHHAQIPVMWGCLPWKLAPTFVHGGGLLSFKNLMWTDVPHPQCQIDPAYWPSHKWHGTVKHYTSWKSKSKIKITSSFVSYI